MMDGFLRALEQFPEINLREIKCLCAWDISSQRRRFPQLTWIDAKEDSMLQRELDRAETIIGFGDTPFQLTSGDWFLRHMVKIFSRVKPEATINFINVGAETEITPQAGEFAKILKRLNFCSVRDVFSQGILAGLKVKPADEIRLGGDFANVSLPELAKSAACKKIYALGVVWGFDTLSLQDSQTAKNFLKSKKSGMRTAFITGDSRTGAGFEYDLYQSWTSGWFSSLKRKLSLQRPDYSVCSMEDFVRPFAQCETIISSRYHGLLTAAWLGCKVAAVARSSKVTALAKALEIPAITPPIKPGDLEELEKNAVRVAPERLEELRHAAVNGLRAAFAC